MSAPVISWKMALPLTLGDLRQFVADTERLPDDRSIVGPSFMSNAISVVLTADELGLIWEGTYPHKARLTIPVTDFAPLEQVDPSLIGPDESPIVPRLKGPSCGVWVRMDNTHRPRWAMCVLEGHHLEVDDDEDPVHRGDPDPANWFTSPEKREFIAALRAEQLADEKLESVDDED